MSTTTITATNICDATGTKLASGIMTFQPCDTKGNPLSFGLAGGGQVVALPIQVTITTGSIGSFALEGGTVSSPANICYLVTIQDANTGCELLPTPYIIQPFGGAWSFDTFEPTSGALTVLTGSTGPQGPQGVAGIASWQQLAGMYARLPIGLNLFNPATATADNTAINPLNGATETITGFTSSDYIPANANGSMISNVSVYGMAFYDGNFTFISGINGPSAASTAFSVPSTAAFVRVTFLDAALPQAMVCYGSSVPSTYQPFGRENDTHVDTLVQQIIQSILPNALNLFNPATATIGYALTTAGGLAAFSGYWTSAKIFVIPGATYTLAAADGVGAGYGLVWYDATGTVIGSVNSPMTANQQVTAPANAVGVRFCGGPSILTTQMFCMGTTVPSEYQAFGIAPNPDNTTLVEQIESVVDARFPSQMNLIDTTALTVGAISTTDGTVTAYSGYSVTPLIPVQPGGQYSIALADTSGAGHGIAFYDGNEFFVSGLSWPYTAAQVFTVPAGAVYLRMSLANSTVAAQMLINGPTVPSLYIPFASTATAQTVSTMRGRRIGFWGDSLTSILAPSYGAYQKALLARLGAVQAFCDARGGRNWTNVFEFYGGFPLNQTTSLNETPTVAASLSTSATLNTGTVGNTLAQDLANVDMLIVWLGTNGDTGGIGVYTDASYSAATSCGYMNSAIQAWLTANPAMRIVLVTPYANAIQSATYNANIGIAIKAVALQYGIPVLDMLANSGLNSYTSSLLTVDGTHGSATGYADYFGPTIAEFVRALL